jgi:hypothetical protein
MKKEKENRKGFIEKDLIIYTDTFSGSELKKRLQRYGVVFLCQLGKRIEAEYWRCMIPYDLNERLAKYDPELRMETSLSFYDLDMGLMKRLPERFVQRRAFPKKVFYVETNNTVKGKEVF